MLTDLLKRKSHVLKAVETAKARARDLEAERAEAKGRLWTLEQERDRLTRTIYDEKARALLAEDRRPIEQEIERLQARQPLVSAAIEELAQELLPRLEAHLQEAEQAVKAEALKLKHQAAIRATEGRDALLRQWNASTADLLRVAEAIGSFNGRFEFHQKGYREAADEQRQPTQPTGEHIPSELLHALRVALGGAWQTGYARGEGLANEEQIHL